MNTLKKQQGVTHYESPTVDIYCLQLEEAILTASNASIQNLEETDFQW